MKITTLLLRLLVLGNVVKGQEVPATPEQVEKLQKCTEGVMDCKVDAKKLSKLMEDQQKLMDNPEN